MRLWSIHPQYLDTKGLVALWREALLARAVLANPSSGYQHHPQLTRFRAQSDPVASVNAYLYPVFEEACKRNFQFDSRKLNPNDYESILTVTEGQLFYEFGHLRNKLARRDPERYRQSLITRLPEPHPIFTVIPGEVEFWEKTTG
jgi:hypothetical protein